VAVHSSEPRLVEPVVEPVVALEAGPRVAEHFSGLVLALEAESRMADFEGSKYLCWVEVVLDSE